MSDTEDAGDIELDDEAEPEPDDVHGGDEDDEAAGAVTAEGEGDEAAEGEGDEDAAEGEGAEPAAAPAAPRYKLRDVVRDSNTSRADIIVAPADRMTSGVLTLTEAAAVIAMRAAQIDKTGRVFVESKKSEAVELALEELKMGRCPLALRRQVGVGPNGEAIYEQWDLRTMALPPL